MRVRNEVNQGMTNSYLPTVKEEELRLNLQYFADDNNGEGGSGDDGGNAGGSEPENLDELIKQNPKLKEQLTDKMKKEVGRRMKKFEGIDPEDYQRLKEEEEERIRKEEEGKNREEDKSQKELDRIQRELEKRNKEIQRAENREKRAIVKEFAIDEGYDAKLLSRLIELDKLELDDDGEAINLDELFSDVKQEFPDYFGERKQDEGEGTEGGGGNTSRRVDGPGTRQKNNNNAKKPDLYDIGKTNASRLIEQRKARRQVR